MKYLKLFERKNIGVLYHFTSLVNTYFIILNNELESHREIDPQIINTYPKTSKFTTTFSFTRDKYLNKKIEEGQIDTILTCRLEFDGGLLSDKYVLKPYNWKGDFYKEIDNIKNFKEHGFESEEVLVTNQNEIQNIDKYLIRYTVPTLEKFAEEFEFYAEHDVSFFYRLLNIIQLMGDPELDYFDESDRSYDDDLIYKTYHFILKELDKGGIPYSVSNS